jgi:hypothetical protein
MLAIRVVFETDDWLHCQIQMAATYGTKDVVYACVMYDSVNVNLYLVY